MTDYTADHEVAAIAAELGARARALPPGFRITGACRADQLAAVCELAVRLHEARGLAAPKAAPVETEPEPRRGWAQLGLLGALALAAVGCIDARTEISGEGLAGLDLDALAAQWLDAGARPTCEPTPEPLDAGAVLGELDASPMDAAVHLRTGDGGALELPAGAWCGPASTWLLGARGDVQAWALGLRRDGYAELEGERLAVSWVGMCDARACSPLSEREAYTLRAAPFGLVLGGVSLTPCEAPR